MYERLPPLMHGRPVEGLAGLQVFMQRAEGQSSHRHQAEKCYDERIKNAGRMEAPLFNLIGKFIDLRKAQSQVAYNVPFGWRCWISLWRRSRLDTAIKNKQLLGR